MLVRTSLITGLAAVLLSTAALADSATTTATKPKPTQNTQKLADRCSALETQFDQAVAAHGSAAKLAAAKQLRTKGATLCNSNKQNSGIKDLTQALKDLGVKPNA